MSTKEIGDYGERLAVRYLRFRGYRILDRNYMSKHGEIDIIARKKDYLVFVEVKTRTNQDVERYGRPAKAVNYCKREHIRYAIKDYLRTVNNKCKLRIDIIEVYLTSENSRKYRIEHIQNAFGGKG